MITIAYIRFLIPIFLIVINAVGFIFMGYDKRMAKKGAWRIAESRLFIIACLGGAVGVWLGMNVFRHKTKHRLFQIGLPLLTLLNISIMFLIWIYIFV